MSVLVDTQGFFLGGIRMMAAYNDKAFEERRDNRLLLIKMGVPAERFLSVFTKLYSVPLYKTMGIELNFDLDMDLPTLLVK